MKTKMSILVLVLALSLIVAGLVLANGTAAINKWVFGGGGGLLSFTDRVALNGTLGQPVIGPSSADTLTLGAGYWYEGQPGAPTPIIIGVAAPMSGPIGDGGYGWQQLNAVQLAISQTNEAGGISIGGVNYPLSLVVADSACDASQAETAANELLAARSVAVVGPACSVAFKASAPIYGAAGVATVSPSVTDPTLTQQGYTTTFRTISHEASSCTALANHFYDLDLRNAAIMLRDGTWSDIVAAAFEDAYTAIGGTVVSRHRISTTADITPTLDAIKLEGAQVIFVTDVFGPVAGEVSRIATELSMTQTLGMVAPVDKDMYIHTHAGPQAAEGDYGAGSQRRPVDMPGYVPFEAAYVAAAFPNEPTPGVYSPTAYDAAMIIIDAIQRAGTAADALAIRDAIAATTDYAGVTGTYQRFDENGDIVPQWGRVDVVEDGEWVPAWVQVEVYPEIGGTLDLDNTLGTQTTIEIPPEPGAATLETRYAPLAARATNLAMTYTMLYTTTDGGNPLLTMVGSHGLRLEPTKLWPQL